MIFSVSKALLFSILALGVSAQNSTATTTASDVVTSPPPDAVCPTVDTPSCRWLCRQSAAIGSWVSCGENWGIGVHGEKCTACPGIAATCGSPSCAYLCTLPAEEGGTTFCSNQNTFSSTLVTCKPCGGSTTPFSNATSTSAGIPPPTYTGGASALKVGGGAIAGLIGMMFAL
ncbi:hypothetical protein H072_11129 [Dactylellina haptotyla CBS 200.50]|uniref:Uncharacterized protein n=1 Tax=Dactylellina haptotyla (strain CBS 200.50) TaxID=1284197 RepID=S7ZXJ3_DACHA|nr:hypothetical protein H072_11129 [Dactylellina haptotyla CBS 200.50]